MEEDSKTAVKIEWGITKIIYSHDRKLKSEKKSNCKLYNKEFENLVAT